MNHKLNHPDQEPAVNPYRTAIYARISSDMQNELSIEDQVSACREEIARRGWRVAGIYTDTARSGWSLDRDGFQEMRTAAEKQKFDALMLWKFDRLARDHNHTVMIKALLRHQYQLKLFCVEGVSSDDDDTPYTTLVEQMIAVFSSFYSQNLSSDTKRAKRARAMRGEFNGSVAPVGYILVTRKQAAAGNLPAGLHLDPAVAPIIREAFEQYATGSYCDRELAEWLNEQPAIQDWLIAGKRRPIGKEMVRDLLQNKTYTGRVSYAETIYDGSSLGQKRRSRRKRIEWFEGRHEAIIDDTLFETCLGIRKRIATTRKTPGKSRTYILPDRVYCAHCLARSDRDWSHPHYGKMRLHWQKAKKGAIYRCMARDRGYGDCDQPIVHEQVVLDGVVQMIGKLVVPDGVMERIDTLVKSRPSNQAALDQLAELDEQKQRLQFSWEHGLLPPDEYLSSMHQLEREIASMRPLDYDRLEEALDLMTYFRSYWDQCADVENPAEARQQLLAKIVDRVFVYDNRVIALALHTDFGIIFDVPSSTPHEVMTTVKTAAKKARETLVSSVPKTGTTGLVCSSGTCSTAVPVGSP